MDKQRELSMEDQINKTESVMDELIARRRAELEDDPKDLDKVVKLIEVLIQKEDKPASEEAIKLLGNMLEQTGQYRYKVRIGDVRIRQYARDLKNLKEQIDQDKGDAEARKEYEKTYRERMNFELQEFTERVKNYPTDLGLKFELGRRLFAFKKYDEAIGMFQQAKSDPKYRAVCHEYLGRCFLAQDWLDEAVETLEEGKLHISNNPRLALELRWTLMEAYERLAQRDKSIDQARKAYKLASEILQSNINFRDIKARANKIRDMIKELQAGASEPQA
jgi:tetratricopeptide (TPR) repeat protein